MRALPTIVLRTTLRMVSLCKRHTITSPTTIRTVRYGLDKGGALLELIVWLA